MIVVDASVVAAWLMPDEASIDLEALADKHGRLVAPSLLWAEFRNLVLMNEKRGRLPVNSAERVIQAVDDLGIELDDLPSSDTVVALARRFGLTVYDALYVECALRHGCALATFDQAMARAARAEGITVIVGQSA